jgi:hypothetical protein
MSGALHLSIFDQLHKKGSFGKLLVREEAVTLMRPKLVFAEDLILFRFLLTLTL